MEAVTPSFSAHAGGLRGAGSVQVDTVSAFAKATGISPFIVSFVVTPFASNASELVTSLTFASRKRKRNISLTYSQVRANPTPHPARTV